MKSIVTLSLAASLFITLQTSCAQTRHATDQFEVTPFTTIESSAIADINIRQSSTTEVTAEGSEKLLNLLNVRMEEDKLVLEMEEKETRKFKGKQEKLTIFISIPTLTRIESEGVGNIEFEGTFSTPSLTIESEGVGNIKAEQLEAGEVTVASQGVGNINLAGKSDRVKIESEGVGNVNTSALIANHTTVISQGVGNVRCHASEYLKIRSEGIGNVTYYGSPAKKELSKEGLGRIKEK